MDEVLEIVCSYQKVKEHLEKKPEDKEKIKEYLNEIRGGYSKKAVHMLESFLDKTFVKLYDGVNLHLPEGFSLEETLKDYHVVLCPNHQSHADYIAIQYVLYKNFKLPVYIAAGINLNIFPIGGIFKKCGAFFIRRKFTNNVYKIAFQGYIYYLLKTDKVVEFFFEGGRTRTGKLLSPKYGLFSMILDAHSHFGEDKKPLMFVPVSIAHEFIPEERAHAKELSGAKKEKEKPTQLLKLFQLFKKKLGTVHIRLSKGIVIPEVGDDLKEDTQNIAFDVFRAVGKNMPVTPSSLLSLILLDNPSGVLTWKQILTRAQEILDYCKHMNIQMTDSLFAGEAESALRMAMDMFLSNNKVQLIKRERLNQVFYSVLPEARVHLLYHKNMIVHHFFVPAVMNATWFNIFNGSIKDENDLITFLRQKRKELKFEFYLPENAEMTREAMRIMSYALERKIKHINEVLSLSIDELYKVATQVKNFASALSYIYEAYYISAISIKYLSDDPFTEDQFLNVTKELFEMEKEHGRIVRYNESFTVPKMKSTLEYLTFLEVIEKTDKKYIVSDLGKLNYLIEKFAKDVNDQVSINLKFNQDE